MKSARTHRRFSALAAAAMLTVAAVAPATASAAEGPTDTDLLTYGSGEFSSDLSSNPEVFIAHPEALSMLSAMPFLVFLNTNRA